MRRRNLLAALTAVLGLSALATVLPERALGQGSTSPFSPGLSPTATSPAPATSAATTAAAAGTSGGSGGLSGGAAVAIGIGALAVLGGISIFIWYDARRRAPVRAGAEAWAVDGGRSATKPRPKPRKLSPAERRRRKRGRAR